MGKKDRPIIALSLFALVAKAGVAYLTSEKHSTSEEPVLLYGDFSGILFDGSYSNFALSGETRIVINLNP